MENFALGLQSNMPVFNWIEQQCDPGNRTKTGILLYVVESVCVNKSISRASSSPLMRNVELVAEEIEDLVGVGRILVRTKDIDAGDFDANDWIGGPCFAHSHVGVHRQRHSLQDAKEARRTV